MGAMGDLKKMKEFDFEKELEGPIQSNMDNEKQHFGYD